MLRPLFLLAFVASLAFAGLVAHVAVAQGTAHKRIALPDDCPNFYPCDVALYDIPQYAEGADPLCYGAQPCGTNAASPPLPQAELDAYAVAAWAAMRREFAAGHLTDRRDAEHVPIRWDDPPTVSVCWAPFWIAHPACNNGVATCTGKVSWATADAFKPATWRVAIRTDVDAATQRELVVEGVVNLVLMLTQNPDLYTGEIHNVIKRRVLLVK